MTMKTLTNWTGTKSNPAFGGAPTVDADDGKIGYTLAFCNDVDVTVQFYRIELGWNYDDGDGFTEEMVRNEGRTLTAAQLRARIVSAVAALCVAADVEPPPVKLVLETFAPA